MDAQALQPLIARAYVAAMLGELEQADALVAQARAAAAYDPASTAQLMLIEGVAASYRNDAARAGERLQRAALIGSQLGMLDLAALAQGWLALIEYNHARFEQAAALLAPTVARPDLPDDRVRLRSASLLMLLCEYAGAPQATAQWQLAARLAAGSLGVAGALSTVMFNQAVAAIDKFRIGRLRGQLDAAQARELLLRVESAINYDGGAGVGPQPALHRLALGMALNLCGEHARARVELQAFLAQTDDRGAAGWVCAQAELGAAELALGPQPLPAAVIADLQAVLELPADGGERALALSVLAEHARRCGQDAQALDLRRQRELQAHDRQAQRLHDCLAATGLLAVPPHWRQ